MEYPQEIYAVFNGAASTRGRQHAYEVGFQAGRAEQADYIKSISSLESVLVDVEQLEGEDLPFVKRLIERAFRAGKADAADPLKGYSNLTAAIEAGDPVGWEELDGLKVQCVNLEMGTLRGVLTRRGGLKPDSLDAWWDANTNLIYSRAFCHSWLGLHGWSLWVEGEIPLRRKTADQLKVGTYFLGEIGGQKTAEMYVGETLNSKVVLYTPCMGESDFPASEWVVLEELGTFQKPEGK